MDLFDHLEQAVRMNMLNDTFARFMKQHPLYAKKNSLNNKGFKLQETNNSFLLASPRMRAQTPQTPLQQQQNTDVEMVIVQQQQTIETTPQDASTK